MASPPDGRSLSRGEARVERGKESEDSASRWLQRLLLATGLLFFLGGLVVVAGPSGLVPFPSDASGPPAVGGSGGGTPTPDDPSAGGTPTPNGSETGTPKPTDGGRPANTSGSGDDGSTPNDGSDGNQTSTPTPTPTPEPVIGIG